MSLDILSYSIVVVGMGISFHYKSQ